MTKLMISTAIALVAIAGGAQTQDLRSPDARDAARYPRPAGEPARPSAPRVIAPAAREVTV